MNAKYSIRIFRSEDINNELSMVMELGMMDLHLLWMIYREHFHEKHKEFEMDMKNGTIKMQEMAIKHRTYWEDRNHLLELIKHLYTEMMRAVAEFHQIGMHLDLKLTNFLAVLDQNGTLINMPNGQIRVTTKLIDFGGANLINPDRYRVDLPLEIRQQMIVDTTACIRHNVDFGTAHYISPEQVKSCNGFYMGDAPYAILCHKTHPIRDLPKYEGQDDEMRKRRDEEIRQRRKMFKACLYEMAKNPEEVDRIEYPRNADMEQDGTKHLWNIIKASLQYNPRLRPTAKGILAYLRRECRLQINRMGDLMGYHKDVPWKRCELEPKEGELISRDPNRFNPN